MSTVTVIIKRMNLLVQNPLANTLFRWANIVLVYGSFLLPVLLYFTDDYKIFGSISWALLIVIMVVRPLADLFPGILLFRKLVITRRGMGVLSGMAALTHGIGYFYLYPVAIGQSYLWALNQTFLYGIIALVFSTLLLVTSNNFSIKFLGKKWKWLQRGIYGMFYMTCIHIALIGHRGIDYAPIIL